MLTLVLSGLHAGAGSRFAALLLIALLMGLEAATLKRWTLARRGWRQLDVVIADDEDAAERRFFDRWSDKAPDFYQPPVERGGAAAGALAVIGARRDLRAVSAIGSIDGERCHHRL